MLRKWILLVSFISTFISYSALATELPNCVEEGTASWMFLQGCQLSLTDVEKLNAFYSSNPDYSYLFLVD